MIRTGTPSRTGSSMCWSTIRTGLSRSTSSGRWRSSRLAVRRGRRRGNRNVSQPTTTGCTGSDCSTPAIRLAKTSCGVWFGNASPQPTHPSPQEHPRRPTCPESTWAQLSRREEAPRRTGNRSPVRHRAGSGVKPSRTPLAPNECRIPDGCFDWLRGWRAWLCASDTTRRWKADLRCKNCQSPQDRRDAPWHRDGRGSFRSDERRNAESDSREPHCNSSDTPAAEA